MSAPEALVGACVFVIGLIGLYEACVFDDSRRNKMRKTPIYFDFGFLSLLSHAPPAVVRALFFVGGLAICGLAVAYVLSK